MAGPLPLLLAPRDRCIAHSQTVFCAILQPKFETIFLQKAKTRKPYELSPNKNRFHIGICGFDAERSEGGRKSFSACSENGPLKLKNEKAGNFEFNE